MRLLFLILVLVVVACAPTTVREIRATPPDYVPPFPYQDCIPQETVRLSNGRLIVIVECPNLVLGIDYKTGEVVERVKR